jgi:uncharacterized short protein YbdD (DUF466 family)
MLGRRTGGQAGGQTGLTALLGTLRSIAGMPDYDLYAEHLRRCHPEHPVPTQRQFYEEFLKSRYEDGPTRCC